MWLTTLLALLLATALTGGAQRQPPEAIKQMAPPEAKAKQYRLPSYFDYDLYRRFHGKSGPAPATRARHYLRTALRVFERRAQFRAGRQQQLWSVNELSDLTGAELEALRRPNATGNELDSPERDQDCCSRDQVFRHIIAMLERASSGPRPDWRLSRALVEELEQKPLVSSNPSLEPPTATATSPEPEPERPDRFGETEELREQQAALRRAVESSVRQQVAEALSSPQSGLGKQLQRHFSAYFGQPVQLKAKAAGDGSARRK